MQDELVIELHSELSDIARLAGQVEMFGLRNDVPELVIAHVNLRSTNCSPTPCPTALSIRRAIASR